MDRRGFLSIGGAGLMGLTGLLRAEGRAKAKADSVIMIWLNGGPPSIDMWDMKPDAPAEIRGEFQSIASAVPGLRVCEHLPRMAKTADKVTLIRSLQHSLPVHGPGNAWMTTGNSPIGSMTYPAMGSLASRLLPTRPDLPAYVAAGKGAAVTAGYLGAAHNPFVVESLPGGKTGRVASTAKPQMRGVVLPEGFTLERLEKRDALLAGFDKGLAALDAPGIGAGLDGFHKKAMDILRSPRTRAALELDREATPLRERYGMSPFGQGALMARRLIEAGVRFVTLALAGWDTHINNFPQMRTLLPTLDGTLSALIEDLDGRGMLERTIVYCAGEFGRTPQINKDGGRDHWAKAQTVLLAGGGFRRGHVYGATDKEGQAVTVDACGPDDVAATVFSCLGVGPHGELTTDAGRPVQLFREGRVMRGVMA